VTENPRLTHMGDRMQDRDSDRPLTAVTHSFFVRFWPVADTTPPGSKYSRDVRCWPLTDLAAEPVRSFQDGC